MGKRVGRLGKAAVVCSAPLGLAACAAPSGCVVHVLSDGPSPYCAMTAFDGPTADGQIGALRGPVSRVPCPGRMPAPLLAAADPAAAVAAIAGYRPSDGAKAELADCSVLLP